MSLALLSSIPSFIPYSSSKLTKLYEQVIEVEILDKKWGGSHIFHVIYDQSNTAFFEEKLCIGCGAKSDFQNTLTSLQHYFGCKAVQIVSLIGDNIGNQMPSCFQGVKQKDVNRIYTAAKIAYLKNHEFNKNTSPEVLSLMFIDEGLKDMHEKNLQIIAEY